MAGRRVLLTGAGSGIGLSLALRLGERGGTLVLVGRRAEPLAEAARLVVERGGVAHVVTADLADPDQPQRVVDAAVVALGGIDVLINNAGNVRAGRLEEMSVPDITRMIAVNLCAPVLLTRAALPHLRISGGEGGAVLLGISSGIALVGLPFYATYAATKAGLARFDEALRRELIGTGVHVATAYPGATQTEMMSSSQAGEELGFGRRPVDEVADEIIAGLEADHSEINTAAPQRREMQQLNARDPLAVDAMLAPRLSELEAAVREPRSM